MEIFLHLPKTGGTTLNDVLRRQFRVRGEIFHTMHLPVAQAARLFLDLPPARRGATRLIMGHTEFGLHRLLPQPMTYFTLLRDPVERVISYFHFVRTKPLQAGHREFNKMTFDQFVETDLFAESAAWQTRMLAGLPPGASEDDMLQQARANLRNHVRIVGLTEDFDGALLLFQRAFDWKLPYYVRRNVTSVRPTQAQINAQTLEIIRERTAPDRQLYGDAVCLFRAAVAAQGPGFADDLARFQRVNREYQAIDRRLCRLRRPFGVIRRTLLAAYDSRVRECL